MAWTAPMTAVANTAFTAAQFNTHVRDNLLETAPAKATTSGSHFTVSSTNQIAQRLITSARVDTQQATSSTTYTDLATVGPSVTVATGTRALVAINASCSTSADNTAGAASVAVSGATTIAANDSWCIFTDGLVAGNFFRAGISTLFTTLNAGNNTFTMQYKAGSTTATYQLREIVVMPF